LEAPSEKADGQDSEDQETPRDLLLVKIPVDQQKSIGNDGQEQDAEYCPNDTR
jgi:hypothetical protein